MSVQVFSGSTGASGRCGPARTVRITGEYQAEYQAKNREISGLVFACSREKKPRFAWVFRTENRAEIFFAKKWEEGRSAGPRLCAAQSALFARGRT
jgi:hypothetical protein